MGTAFLHIGMHKTGSSSIQKTLYSFRQNLGEYCYLDMGRSNASGALQYAFLDADDNNRININKGNSTSFSELLKRKDKELKTLSYQLDQARGKNIIISAEGLLKLPLSGLHKLKMMIDTHFENTIVVAYVRPPRSYMESATQQILQSSSIKLDKFTIRKPKYRDRFEKFEQVFGKNTLRYWLFDRKSLQGGCVVNDFCRRLGLKVNADRIIRTNKSLSIEAFKLLYLYRKYFPNQSSASGDNRLIRKLKTLSGDKLHFSEVMMTKSLTELGDHVSWMEERLGKNSLNEPPPLPSIQQISAWTDLEHIQAPTKKWLSQELGHDFSSRNSPESIAQGISTLRIKLNTESAAKQVSKTTISDQLTEISKINFTKQTNYTDDEGEIIMEPKVLKVKTIIESIKAQDPNITDVKTNKAVKLVLSVFGEILQKLENTEKGDLRVAGLGMFKVRTAEAKQGKKKGHMVKKVFFTPKSGS